jgi:hypothetical protein
MKNSHNQIWQRSAVCLRDKNSSYWLSYNIEHIKYAKEGCKSCSVKTACLANALSQEFFIGVNAGISEWDYLNKTWKEVKSVRKTNWSRSDATLRKLLQEAK